MWKVLVSCCRHCLEKCSDFWKSGIVIGLDHVKGWSACLLKPEPNIWRGIHCELPGFAFYKFSASGDLSFAASRWSSFGFNLGSPRPVLAEDSILSSPLRALGLLLADGTPTGGRGEDFWSRQPDFFTETAVTPERKVEKSFPRWEINRHVEG